LLTIRQNQIVVEISGRVPLTDVLQKIIKKPKMSAEELKAAKARYYQEHKEELKAWQARYYQEHKEELKAAKARYYQEHKEELKAWQAPGCGGLR
jgi:Asp-tRNA(Asn)/Glu-tRNA(Gln) amidotransferase A subunit family amidase